MTRPEEGGASLAPEQVMNARVPDGLSWCDWGARGKSMEPPLPDECSILFDRSRRVRREHPIYMVRSDAGLIVKRAARRGQDWELTSDNPGVAPEPWPADSEVIGKVAWVAQTLIRPQRG